MFSVDKVLVPVAFSDNCRGCARYAAALASRFKSEIILTYVLEPLGNALEFATGLDDIRRYRTEWFSRELEAFFRTQLCGFQVKRTLLEGDPALEIVKFAHDEQADLIIMPTHGHGPFRRLLMGSVTAKVLHDARCPVWTGVHLERALIAHRIGLGTIVCAVDLGSQTCETLEWAAGLAEASSSKLVVLHAIPTLPDGSSLSLGAQMARERLDKHLAALGISADVRVITGEKPARICHAVEAEQADLLVIGRGHAGRRGGRLPSTAYTILRESRCPVVSV